VQQNCHPYRSVAQWRELRFLCGVRRISFRPTYAEANEGHPDEVAAVVYFARAVAAANGVAA
jgi:hypothetical protein